jgi:hypothetical protein
MELDWRKSSLTGTDYRRWPYDDISPNPTWLGPQPPHTTANKGCSPWSDGFDPIFRNELEHLDIVPEFEGRFANEPVTFPAPLTVITAAQGFSGMEDQATWLAASPDGRQVELDGGHEIYLDDPEGAAAEVIALVHPD